MYQRAAVAACAACRVAATPGMCMQVTRWSATSPHFRRAGVTVRSPHTVEPCPWARMVRSSRRPAAARPERSGTVTAAQRWSPVPRPRAARHHDDRGPKGPETRSSVGPTVGPRGGWRNRAARTGDGRCGIRGFGPTRIGRHRSGPHWTRHEPSAGTCAAIRSEDGAMHHHLHHHHSVLDGAVYSTKGSKALRSS